MKTPLALLSIAIFTGIVGFILYSTGVGDHHLNPLWAFGTSIFSRIAYRCLDVFCDCWGGCIQVESLDSLIE